MDDEQKLRDEDIQTAYGDAATRTGAVTDTDEDDADVDTDDSDADADTDDPS